MLSDKTFTSIFNLNAITIKLNKETKFYIAFQKMPPFFINPVRHRPIVTRFGT